MEANPPRKRCSTPEEDERWDPGLPSVRSRRPDGDMDGRAHPPARRAIIAPAKRQKSRAHEGAVAVASMAITSPSGDRDARMRTDFVAKSHEFVSLVEEHSRTSSP